MKADRPPRYYRIGEFAQKLGVTPDFLKYCEKQGFITPLVEKNGYRYYEFSQAATVIEYIKLKNQGCSANEIRKFMHVTSFEENFERIEANAQRIHQQMQFYEALLVHYEGLHRIRDNFTDKPVWYIQPMEGFYFLPHSVGPELTCDPHVLSRVRAWNEWLPIVASTARIRLCDDPDKPFCWGFSVPEHFAQRQHLDVSAPAVHVASGRCLEVNAVTDINRADECLDFADTLLSRFGLTPLGDAYHVVISKLWENQTRRCYASLYIPLSDS